MGLPGGGDAVSAQSRKHLPIEEICLWLYSQACPSHSVWCPQILTIIPDLHPSNFSITRPHPKEQNRLQMWVALVPLACAARREPLSGVQTP